MKQLGIWSFALMAALGGCNKPTPVVVLDGWWNADYAKNRCESAKAWQRENAEFISQFGCEKVTSCPDMMPIVEACVLDPVQDVRMFEDKLATEFAANPDCSAVQFIRFTSPDEKSKAASDALQEQHWMLMLDYSPGAQKQYWSMVRSADRSAFTQGEGGPDEIVRKVCAIVSQRGATIVN